VQLYHFSPKFLMQSILSEKKQCIMCIAKFVVHGCCLLISSNKLTNLAYMQYSDGILFGFVLFFI